MDGLLTLALGLDWLEQLDLGKLLVREFAGLEC